jgi:GT2 family glycosyltransferase
VDYVGERSDDTARHVPVCDDITVVVPTLGRDILRQCLDAMAAGSMWPRQIIVVDQGRRAEVEAMIADLVARGLDARWVPSTLTGKSAGLNQGFRLVKTRFVAITDDDCIVAADWLETMVRWLRQEPDAIITGRVEAGDGEVNLAVETSEVSSVQTRPALKHDRMVGGNMGLAMDTIVRVGGFEEDPCMRNAEDPEYAYRALRRGVRIVYTPDVVLLHLGWRDECARLQQYEQYARSHGGFYGKYLRRGDLFILVRVAVHLTRAGLRWLQSSIRGDAELARNGRAYVIGLLPGIIAGWRSKAGR